MNNTSKGKRRNVLSHEVDSTMQWGGTISSLASSEPSTDIYNAQAQTSCFSADVSSLTSLDHLQDSGIISTDLGSQTTEIPQPSEHDFSYMASWDPAFEVNDDDVRLYLQSLGDQGNANQPQQGFPGLPLSLIGIPSEEPRSSSQIQYEDVMNRIYTAYRTLMSNQTLPCDRVYKAMQDSVKMYNFFRSKLPVHPDSLNESLSPGKERYQCPSCPKNPFEWNSFKRHLATHKISEAMFICPEANCGKIVYRRDRMREHLMNAHRAPNPSKSVLQETKQKRNALTSCPICHQMTTSWEDVYSHMKGHCVIVGSGNTSINGDRHYHGGNGEGGGGNGGNGEGPSSAGPCRSNNPAQSFGGHSNIQTADPNFLGGSFVNSRDGSNVRPGFISHSASDEQINHDNHQRSHHVIEEPSMDHHLLESRGFGDCLPEGPRRGFNKHEAQPTPESSRADQSTQKRKRKREPKRPTNQVTPDLRICKRCNHNLTGCQKCTGLTGSFPRCHKCSDSLKSGHQAGPSSMTPGHSNTSPTVLNLNQGYPNDCINFGMPQQMFTQPSYDYIHGLELGPGAEMRPTSFGATPDNYLDEDSLGDQYVEVVRVVEDHTVLGDLYKKAQGSHGSKCDTKLLRSIGLDTLIGPFPAKGQLKQTETAILGDPTPKTCMDLVLQKKSSPDISNTTQRVSQCQCPCARARFEISPNQRAGVTFKMAPERESGHSLRTRVQVVVKLFKLRTSVTQSSTNDKQRARSIASNAEFIEDTEADADSGYESSDTSPSEELVSMNHWGEVEHFSFSFDMEELLSELYQLVSGLDADEGLFLFNPTHILNLISMLSMYYFKTPWWFMGLKGLDLRWD